jgi:mono/diheme cytochrome c family protein
MTLPQKPRVSKTKRHSGPLIAALAVILGCGLVTTAARSSPPQENGGLKLSSGEQTYRSACIACHGPAGKGTPQEIRGFKEPSTFPDFTRCDQTTSELNNDYRAVVTNGGPYRGFSQIMPSFKQALTPHEIDEVIHYIRSFCDTPRWPRGELNLPLALATEKAYPEDEVVWTSSVNATGPGGVETHVIYEQRFGVKNQLELDVPFSLTKPDRTWYGGIGDISMGVKRVIFSHLATDQGLGAGTIFSLQGNINVPTGNSTHGLGAGTTEFEPLAEFGQLFRTRTFVQFQTGATLPVDTNKAPQSVFWHTALGQMIPQGNGLGRIWSPMVEFLADRDLVNHATTDWDVLPEMQVTLSKRQHVRGDVGVRMPLNNTRGRPVQVLFYLLWDWQEGSLLKGW